MSYSNTTFTVEITGVPTVVFQTKWHREADAVCRSWAQQHWDQLTTKGRHGGLELPPIVNVRLAQADEKIAHELAVRGTEYHQGVKVVYLADMVARPWAHTAIARTSRRLAR
jgi:hypothetical protein